MCFSAIHWAKIEKIVYGAAIEDARKLGFSELSISNLKMKEWGLSPVQVCGPFLKEEALELFRSWSKRADRRV
jgi:tRNA(Arg) A34 adenosine deaminase TadA